MNKKHFSFALVLIVLIATGTVFAQDTCNYYESGTSQVDAKISINGKTATINVKSYVGRERIEIYKVVVGNETFGIWDITGTTEIGPHGSTTIKVTSEARVTPFGGKTNFTVYLKTCE
jgi:hypothetical protein